MNSIRPALAKRLLFILHYGLTETRSLAAAGKTEQIADLTDALELLPGYVNHWEESHLEMIRFNLRTYQEKYPGRAFDYLAHLEDYDPPEHF